jgi:hypothetical protein
MERRGIIALLLGYGKEEQFEGKERSGGEGG